MSNRTLWSVVYTRFTYGRRIVICMAAGLQETHSSPWSYHQSCYFFGVQNVLVEMVGWVSF